MKRKPDVPHTTIRNSNNIKLNQVVGLKYVLWVLIVILSYFITTKDRQSTDSTTTEPIANKVTHRTKHKRKRHIRQPLIVKADSIHVSDLSALDTTTVQPATNHDTLSK